jgi:hypothetical protein
MARKPNYQFDRRERERLKAEKKAERAAAKEEARKKKAEQPDSDGVPSDASDDGQ